MRLSCEELTETYTFRIATEANEDGSYEYKILNKMELNNKNVNAL